MDNEEKFYLGLNNHQRLFLVFTLGVLVDLTVLNLFDEHWFRVTIESFSVSLAAAFLLQILLKATINVEHKIAQYFKSQDGLKAKIYRALATWLILVLSKFVMLGAINFTFGNLVEFSGPLHGVVSFVVVLFTMLIAEAVIKKIYFALDDEDDSLAIA